MMIARPFGLPTPCSGEAGCERERTNAHAPLETVAVQRTVVPEHGLFSELQK